MRPDEIAQLRRWWVATFQALGPARAESAYEPAFDDLCRRYRQPGRHYHRLDHVWAILQLPCLWETAVDIPAMQRRYLAVFFHDVVYDSRAKDNEERSADYAREVLASFGVRPSDREEVARLILLTKRHETTADDKDGHAILDADLSILGGNEPEYDAYAAAIRREYDWVSDDDYRAGRSAVLQRFLARPRIYYTERMFQQREAKARANLAREIASLGV